MPEACVYSRKQTGNSDVIVEVLVAAALEIQASVLEENRDGVLGTGTICGLLVSF